MTSDKNIDLKYKIFSLAKNSLSDVVAKIALTKGLVPKLIWTVIISIAGSYWFYLISNTILEFYAYPVTTKNRHNLEKEVKFPAIAFCANNPFTTDFAFDYLTSLIETFPGSSKFNESYETKFEFIDRYYAQFKYKITTDVYYQLNQTVQQLLGVPENQFFLSCMFKGIKCRAENLEWFFSWKYGNCFSFNSNSSIKTSHPDSALVVELFNGIIGTSKSLNPGTGFHIMIYNYTENMKFNYYFETHSILTGTETNIAIKRTFRNKLPKPYSECTLDTNAEKNVINKTRLYYDRFLREGIKYKQLHCFRTAYRLNTYRKCGCMVISGDVDGVTKMCVTHEEIDCDAESFYTDFILNKFHGEYDEDCPLECYRNVFDLTMTMLSYPSRNYASRLLRKLGNFDMNSSRENLTVSNIRESVAKVNLYYSDLEYGILEEVATFSFIDLLSNVGGTLGLLLGMSLLSLLEIIEFLVIIINHYFKRLD